MQQRRTRPRVVVVGAGFGGLHALRTLERVLPAEAAELTVVSPTDYMLYLPLLPEVMTGILDPRELAVSLRSLRRTELVLGSAVGADLEARTIDVLAADGNRFEVGWDRLLLAAGSVTRVLPLRGVPEHARGFKTLGQAVYLRDHLLRQLELAQVGGDPGEQRACCTFVVIGAGYTGTEVAAHGKLLTDRVVRRSPGLRPGDVRWVLVEQADRVLPQMSEHLSGPALEVLRRRGVEVRLGASVSEITDSAVRLTDGATIPTRTLVWAVGVTPGPLVDALGLPAKQGRILVEPDLTVKGHPEVYAVGDFAAVPDLARSGELTGMTAQHAERQGKRVGRNLAASLGHGQARSYRHRDLGFVVDLGGFQAVADPLGVPLRGIVAKAVTRGYHLYSLPGNRLRVAADWLLDAVAGRQLVQLGLVHSDHVHLAEAERTDIYAERLSWG
jgi:NADH dehydrogenase